MSASLIGSIGQALFLLSSGPFTHPGHASLRSLNGSCKEPLHACVGLAVGSLAFGRTSICAAVIYGFIHRPRPVRTTPSGLVVASLDHAVPSTWSERNSVPSTHIRCRRTAILRATATVARLRPLVRVSRMPHDFNDDPALARMSREFAAA